jgi:glycosyltransferase involved in cell wall biosynthesis
MKKRLLCIISSLNAGGAETFLMKVARALPPEEYQLDFIVSEENGCYTQDALERGCRIFSIPLRTKDFLGAVKAIKRIVSENGYHSVLKLSNTPIGVVDLIAAKMGGAKKLALRSCNALTGLSLPQKVVNACLRPILNMVTNVKLAPSMLAAEFTFGKRVAHQEVHIINNGVDLNIFCFDAEGRKQVRKEFSADDKFVIGHIGRFHRQKNHRFLLDVFKSIKEKRENAILLLVGTGELEEDIRNHIVQLNLEDSVIFTGLRFDIPQVLSAMDVFVFPSFYEGMPNTVIEAQSTGLPCVIADTITSDADITGLVRYLPLEVGVDAWAQTALQIGDNGRKDTKTDFASKGYDIESVAKKMMRLCF